MIHSKSKTVLTVKSSTGAAWVVLSSFFYASYGIWTKLMGDFFDGFTASTLRALLVVILLIPFALVSNSFEPLNVRKNWTFLLGMFFASLFTWGPLYTAILQAGVSMSLAVNYAALVLGMLFFGSLFAGEKFTVSKMISAVFGISGLLFIFSPSSTNVAWIALLGAVVSGLASALGAVFAKKVQYNTTQATLVWWTTSIFANAVMAYFFSKAVPAFGFQIEWFYLVLFACSSIIASWSFVKGVKLLDAGLAGIIGLLEIVFGVMVGVLFFGEILSVTTVIGVGFILLSAAMPYLVSSRFLQSIMGRYESN